MEIWAKSNMQKLLKTSSYLIAPLFSIFLILTPLSIDSSQKIFLIIFSFVITMWLLTDIPLFITGIFGVCASVLFGVVGLTQALAPFSNPIIFLFMGGFLLSKALEMTSLDQTLADVALNNNWTRKNSHRCVFVFLFLSFFLSMWISNTAAVAMLLPICYGLIKRLKKNYAIENEGFNETLLIALAYSATVGGNVTPIGSPPNIIAIGFLSSLTGKSISFIEWMFYTAPISIILFYFIFKLSVKNIPKVEEQNLEGGNSRTIIDYKSFSLQQKHVICVFTITVFLWIFPSLIGLVVSSQGPVMNFITNNLSSSIVGLFMASTLFIFPLTSADKILKSEHMSQIDWPSLLLFGSGLSLGSILFQSGLASLISDLVITSIGQFPITIVFIILFLFTIFFTELASNTASANILIPIMISLSLTTGVNPTIVTVVFALCCNSAFMLPVATPPNAIVYGTNKIKKSSMIAHGLKLNLLSWLIFAVVAIIFV